MFENNDNLLNNNVTSTPVPEPRRDETEEEKLRKELEVGEHDIVIEEDFVINIDVAEVSDVGFASEDLGGSSQQVNNQPPVELGSEQSGNITF